MNPYVIYFWHGRPDPTSHFARKVEKICRKRPEDGVFFWDGNLEEFADAWQDKFIYLPSTSLSDKFSHRNELEYVSGVIAITQHGGFGQR